MQLILTADTCIKDLKKQFSKHFPFLKIEFFKVGHKKGKGTLLSQKVHENLQLIDVTGVVREGVLDFEPTITTSEFEQKLQNEFGLPVQVFRKSADLWLETMASDMMTLEEQNRMGKASTSRTNYNMHTLFL